MLEKEKLSCWIVTEGKAGMENQCLGLAEAMDLVPVVKRIKLRWLWRWLSPFFMWGARFSVIGGKKTLGAPWPDVLIACGRKSIIAALAVKKQSQGRTFVVYIKNPRIRGDLLDVIIAPEHDRVTGPNVIKTVGALHRVTSDRLEQARKVFEPLLSFLPSPRIAVVVGGSSGAYELTSDMMLDFAQQLVIFSQKTGASLMITPSRRTGDENESILRETLKNSPHVMWDGRTDNPYLGYLACADGVIVTSDSVSMISEACSTGKPVFIFEWEGGSKKFKIFHDAFYQKGLARKFTGSFDVWSYEPLNETAKVAKIIWDRFRQKL